jgi:DNA-binding response OmpR family regulator
MLGNTNRILIALGAEGEAERAAGVLERAGFDVVVADDAASRLESADGAGFALLLIDAPPAGEGSELARLARPGLRILYLSEHPPRAELDRDAEFIRRPFDAVELVGCVFELLTRGAQRHPERGRASRAQLEATAMPAGPWCRVRRSP